MILSPFKGTSAKERLPLLSEGSNSMPGIPWSPNNRCRNAQETPQPVEFNKREVSPHCDPVSSFSIIDPRSRRRRNIPIRACESESDQQSERRAWNQVVDREEREREEVACGAESEGRGRGDQKMDREAGKDA